MTCVDNELLAWYAILTSTEYKRLSPIREMSLAQHDMGYKPNPKRGKPITEQS